MCAEEIRVAEICAPEMHIAKARVSEVCTTEVRVAEVCAAEDCVAEARLTEIHATKVCINEVCTVEIHTAEVHTSEVRVAEVCAGEVHRNFRIFHPPCIPGLYPLLEQCDAFFIGHVTPHCQLEIYSRRGDQVGQCALDAMFENGRI